jgi:hypothetical protein
MKTLIIAFTTVVLAFGTLRAMSDTCTKTIEISPGHWVGCPDACRWVPPKTETVEYPC